MSWLSQGCALFALSLWYKLLFASLEPKALCFCLLRSDATGFDEEEVT